jgi:hypothetical protein
MIIKEADGLDLSFINQIILYSTHQVRNLRNPVRRIVI